MTVQVKILGAKASAANIARMDKATRRRLFEEIQKISKDILALSKKYVPYLHGPLSRSGKVTAYAGRYPVVYVSYGNAAVPYALLQHEELGFYHPGGRRAKYLESAATELTPQAKKRIETALRTETKKYSMAGRVRGR